jgi:hypothetical protein
MPRRITFLWVVGAVLALLPPAASAQSNAPPDEARSARQRTAVAESGRFAPIAQSARNGRERCNAVKVRRYHENALGGDLFSYYSQVRWCWNRRRITRVDRRRWGEVHYPLWDFKGHIASNSSWGEGRRWYQRFTQGKFQACAVWACFQTKLPWVDIKVRRGGGYTYDTGG